MPPVTEAWVHDTSIRNGKVAAFREYIDTAPVVTEFRMTKAEV
jgi:ketosteroid isomerase-like protein